MILFLIAAAGAILWFSRWLNVLGIPKSGIYLTGDNKYPYEERMPSISVLVPARNEEENISSCIGSLFGQDYPDFDLIVINDRSTDRTSAILEKFKNGQDRVKVLNISELPRGWTGKTHALYEGVKLAKGEWFLFTDADTLHSPLALRNSISYALKNDAEFLSLYPASRGRSFWENITQPLAGSILHLWYPFKDINNPKKKTAFANGQFILVKKECYMEIGGHEKVKGELLEDVAMACEAKAKGKNIKMAYGFNLFSIRMYKGIAGIWRGWCRIFGVLMEKKKSRYPVSLSFIIIFSLCPFFLLFNIQLLSEGGLWPVIYVINIFEIMFLYLTTASIYKLAKNNPLWSIFHPIGSFIMLCIMLDALTRAALRRPVNWRGTLYNR